MGVFTESNRWKHFLFAIPIAMVFTFLCVLGCAAGMEFKDKQWGGKWDWLDFGFTLLGGIVGQLIPLYIIWVSKAYIKLALYIINLLNL